MRTGLIFCFSFLSFFAFSQSAQKTTTLNIGGAGYVTIDHNQYPRGQVYSYYANTRTGDTTLQITGLGLSIGAKGFNKYLDGDNSNTPFASALDLLNWMNSNFEAKPDTIVTGGGGGGGVSSVGLSAPTSVFSVSGSPVTSSGTLGLVFKGGLTANSFLATPDGTTGAVFLRLIGINDLSGFTVTTLRTSVNTTIPTTKAIDDTLTFYQKYSDTSTSWFSTTSEINTILSSYVKYSDTSSSWFSTTAEINVVLSSYAKLISPSFTTPSLGVATATSINKVIFPAPATSSTITATDGKSFSFLNSMILAGTDGNTYTFPTTSASIARRDGTNTFTGVQTFSVASVFSWATTSNGLIYTTGGTGGALQTTSTTPTTVALSSFQLADVTQWTTYTPTITGFSGTPTTNLARYKIVNKDLFLQISIVGTSNASTFTVTLPSGVTAANVQFINCNVQDNSTRAGSVALTSSGSNILTLSKNNVVTGTNTPVAFTTSGGKGLDLTGGPIEIQ